MDRKSFLQKGLAVLALGVSVAPIISCSSDSGDSGPNTGNGQGNNGADCLANGTTSNIGSNHGHTLTVSKADVEAGSEKTYSIQGGSSHNHTIRVTAAHFTDLKSNKSVTVTSSTDNSHTHSVTISCA